MVTIFLAEFGCWPRSYDSALQELHEPMFTRKAREAIQLNIKLLKIPSNNTCSFHLISNSLHTSILYHSLSICILCYMPVHVLNGFGASLFGTIEEHMM